MTSPVLAINTPNGRHYKHPGNGKEVPSITNILDQKNKPALKYWAAKEAARYAASNLDVLSKMKTEQERVDLIKGAPFRSTGDSSKVGNQVHDWVDGFGKHYIATKGSRDWRPEDLKGAPLTARRMWNQFLFLDAHYQFEWLHTETTVWSDKHEYAGTGDAILKIGNKIVFVDWKTSNGVYPETSMQLAALAGADYALDEHGNEFQLPKPDMFAIGHIRPTFTRLSPVNNIPEAFKCFLALRQVFRWQCEISDDVIAYAPQLKGPRA